MFVMCNAVDQTDLKKPAYARVHEAMSHAGPAITITSLTNALAFAFGALSSLEALKSFCLFASVTIVMLYFTVMTVFLSVVVWDTKRVEKKCGECCGACCCEETTFLCCCGFFSTPKQKEYCDVILTEKQVANAKAEYDNASPAMRTVLKASATERCLGKYFVPVILSNIGRIVVLVVYVAMISVAAYGCSELRVHFDIKFFLSERSVIWSWYEANERYFA